MAVDPADLARNSRAKRRLALAPKADNAYILRDARPQSKAGKRVRFRHLPHVIAPMILSMTGFAAVAAELPGVSLAVELRSVNHRYLDVTQAARRAARARDRAARADGRAR